MQNQLHASRHLPSLAGLEDCASPGVTWKQARRGWATSIAPLVLAPAAKA
jgi:hypothetical protein